MSVISLTVSSFRDRRPGKHLTHSVSPACLKVCADQLATVFTEIFNKSLELCEVSGTVQMLHSQPVTKEILCLGTKYYRLVNLMSVERLECCLLCTDDCT